MAQSAPLVLFVCSANVCRSPRAARLFAQGLRDADLGSMLRVTSAGVQVTRGADRCAWMGPEEPKADGRRANKGGGAVSLTAKLLQQASITLCADRTVLSAVIRLAPGSRARAFTFKEAAALGERVFDEHLSVDVADQPGGGLAQLLDGEPSAPAVSVSVRGADSSLAWLTAEMDANRGWLPIETARRRRFRRNQEWSNSFDVPDAHDAQHRVTHPTMFAELEASTMRLLSVVLATLRESHVGV